jgi:serine/threonine protein kinase
MIGTKGYEITNRSQIQFGDIIYALKGSDDHVCIYQGIIYNNIKVAVKIYTSLDLNKYTSEIELLRYLSGKLGCFLIFYGSFRENSSVYIVMEFLPLSLHSFIERRKSQEHPVSDEIVFTVMKSLIEGFDFLESEAIYHRDIKPQNILIDENFSVKIIDFGIALILETEEVENIKNFYPAFGTINYMPPETIDLTKSADKNGYYNLAKSDVYSLGITLLKLITFESIDRSNISAYSNIITNALNKISSYELKWLIKNMLENNPDDRKSFRELLSIFGGKPNVRFPIGGLYNKSQIHLTKVLRKLYDNTYDYEGTINNQKFSIKFYHYLNSDHLDKAKRLLSSSYKLQGSCFLKIFGAFVQDNMVWVVQEPLKYTLFEIIKIRKQYSNYFSEKEAFLYIERLIVGFGYCFQNGIAHNDIRSESIYVTDEGFLKIANFSIPIFARKSKTEFDNLSKNVYLAPECKEAWKISDYCNPNSSISAYKSDIYSLGLVIYELISLDILSYQNINDLELKHKISSLQYDWSKYLLTRMLEKNPYNRANYQELIKIIHNT